MAPDYEAEGLCYLARGSLIRSRRIVYESPASCDFEHPGRQADIDWESRLIHETAAYARP